MKVRDSGMPDEARWAQFFDARVALTALDFIRSKVVPKRSDFEYALAEWSFETEGTGTHVVYRMVGFPASR